MSINLYTGSQADLETLTGIGPKSAGEIIALRNEVLLGQREPLSISDLSMIRLQPENWQQFINDGLFSITFHSQYETYQFTQNVRPDQTNQPGPVTTPQPEQTETHHGQTAQTNIIGQTQQTGQTTEPNQPGQTTQTKQADVKAKQTQIKTTEQLMQESITMLAHEMDGLGKKIFDLGNALTNKIGQLTENIPDLQLQNTGMQTNLQHLEMQNVEIKTKLQCHDVFLKDINTILPPPTPISGTLPIFTGRVNPIQPPVQTTAPIQPSVQTAAPVHPPVQTHLHPLVQPPIHSPKQHYTFQTDQYTSQQLFPQQPTNPILVEHQTNMLPETNIATSPSVTQQIITSQPAASQFPIAQTFPLPIHQTQ